MSRVKVHFKKVKNKWPYNPSSPLYPNFPKGLGLGCAIVEWLAMHSRIFMGHYCKRLTQCGSTVSQKVPVTPRKLNCLHKWIALEIFVFFYKIEIKNNDICSRLLFYAVFEKNTLNLQWYSHNSALCLLEGIIQE